MLMLQAMPRAVTARMAPAKVSARTQKRASTRDESRDRAPGVLEARPVEAGASGDPVVMGGVVAGVVEVTDHVEVIGP